MSTTVYSTRHTQLLKNRMIYGCKADAIAALNNHVTNPAITMYDGEAVASRYWAFFEYINANTEATNPQGTRHEYYDNGGYRLRELPNGTLSSGAPSSQYQVLPSMPTQYTKGAVYEEGALVYCNDKFYEAGSNPSSSADVPDNTWTVKNLDMTKKFACIRTLVGVVTFYSENNVTKPAMTILEGSDAIKKLADTSVTKVITEDGERYIHIERYDNTIKISSLTGDVQDYLVLNNTNGKYVLVDGKLVEYNPSVHVNTDANYRYNRYDIPKSTDWWGNPNVEESALATTEDVHAFVEYAIIPADSAQELKVATKIRIDNTGKLTTEKAELKPEYTTSGSTTTTISPVVIKNDVTNQARGRVGDEDIVFNVTVDPKSGVVIGKRTDDNAVSLKSNLLVHKLTATEIAALQDHNIKEAYKLVAASEDLSGSHYDPTNPATYTDMPGDIIKLEKDTSLVDVKLLHADGALKPQFMDGVTITASATGTYYQIDDSDPEDGTHVHPVFVTDEVSGAPRYNITSGGTQGCWIDISPAEKRDTKYAALCFAYRIENGTVSVEYIPVGSFLVEQEFKNGLEVITDGRVQARLGMGLHFDENSNHPDGQRPIRLTDVKGYHRVGSEPEDASDTIGGVYASERINIHSTDNDTTGYKDRNTRFPDNEVVMNFVLPDEQTYTPGSSVAIAPKENEYYLPANTTTGTTALTITTDNTTNNKYGRETVIYVKTGSSTCNVTFAGDDVTHIFGNTVLRSNGWHTITLKDGYAVIDGDNMATATEYGKIKVGRTLEDREFPLKLDENGKAYTHVPVSNYDTYVKEGVGITIDKKNIIGNSGVTDENTVVWSNSGKFVTGTATATDGSGTKVLTFTGGTVSASTEYIRLTLASTVYDESDKRVVLSISGTAYDVFDMSNSLTNNYLLIKNNTLFENTYYFFKKVTNGYEYLGTTFHEFNVKIAGNGNVAGTERGGIKVGSINHEVDVRNTKLSDETDQQFAYRKASTEDAADRGRYAVLLDKNEIAYVHVPEQKLSTGPVTHNGEAPITLQAESQVDNVSNFLKYDNDHNLTTLNTWDCGYYD